VAHGIFDGQRLRPASNVLAIGHTIAGIGDGVAVPCQWTIKPVSSA
jgi:hypothetical protein